MAITLQPTEGGGTYKNGNVPIIDKDLRVLTQHLYYKAIMDTKRAEFIVALNQWINRGAKEGYLMRNQGETFLKAAEDAKIDVIYLIAHAAHETGWGKPVNSSGGQSIVAKHHNFYGIGAVDWAPMAGAGDFAHDTPEAGIYGGGLWIAKYYIQNEKYQQFTLKKMRYNNGVHQYATDPEWHTKIARIMAGWGGVIAGTNGETGGFSPIDTVINNGDPVSTTGQTIVKKNTTYYQQHSSDPDLKPIDHIAGPVEKPTGVAPLYEDDSWGNLKHRKINNASHYCRIGDTHLAVPPTQIRVSESNGINTYKTVRQKQSMKTHSGAKTRIVEMTLMFPTNKHINGFQIEGPDGKTYYMDGLNSILAQMKSMPFLPIDNHYLNFVHQIYAVAVLNVSVETVTGFPHCLRANLTLLEFDSTPYINAPSELYQHHFMWPLFRWHYQRQLRAEKKEIPTHADYTGDQAFSLWILNEEAMGAEMQAIHDKNKKAAQESVENANDKDKDNDGEYERYHTMFDMNMKDDSLLYEKVDFPNTLTLVSANASTGNTFTPLNIEETGKPAYQYFGSQDTRFNMVFETVDETAIAFLRHTKDNIDRMARQYRDRFIGGLVLVENPFINFHGINACLIESMAVNTVPGFPGRYMVSLSFVSMDKTQYQDEMLNFVSGAWTQNPKQNKFTEKEINGLAGSLAGSDEKLFDNNITLEVAAEEALDLLELYPDLHLPTYKEVNEVIAQINEWRKTKGFAELPVTELTAPIRARFVDPDFFFTYPPVEELAKAIQKSEPDLGFDHLDWKNFFGPGLTEALRDNNSNEILKKRYNDLMMLGADGKTNFADGYQAMINKIESDKNYVLNSANYQSKFWTKAWSSKDGGEWRKGETRAFKGENIGLFYFEGQRPNERELKNSDNEDIANRMTHDLTKYDRRGTMVRAFPSYVFVIVDEGQLVNATKLWNNYYTYHSIVDISVMMDKKNPIHTATITLSNIYGSLNHTNQFHTVMPEYRDPSLASIGRQFMDMFIHQVRKRALEERTKIYDSAQLLAGTRIHLRLGYGSTASLLPPVFNGVVAEIGAGDVVKIIAQSDGHELTKMIAASPGERNNMFIEGIEPQDIFRHYMVERNDNWMFAYRETAEAKTYESAYGIEHFGYLRVADERGMQDFFNPLYSVFGTHFGNKEAAMNAEDYDIMKNIYLTSSREWTEFQQMLSYTDKQLFDMQFKKMEKDLKVAGQWRDSKYNHDLKSVYIYKVPMRGQDATERVTHINEFSDFAAAANALAAGGYTITKLKSGVVIDDLPPEARARMKQGLLEDEKYVDKEFHSYNVDDKLKIKQAMIHYFTKDKYNLYSSDEEKNENVMKEAFKTLSKSTKENVHVVDVKSVGNKIAQDYAKVWKAVDAAKAEIKEYKKEHKTDAEVGALGSEQNVVMRLDNKSPFDVFRTIQRITPEYIVYPHIHNFHYTLFFGKPWWDVQCGYVLPPIGEEAEKAHKSSTGHAWGKRLTDYVELTKPFQQLHYYVGGTDIIGNTIRAVGSNLITSAMPVYFLDKEPHEFDEIIWADYEIRSSFQRVQVINTDLVQDTPVALPFLDSLIEKGLDMIYSGWANAFGKTTKYQKYAVRFVQAAIAETFNDMYQGELIVLGDASAKPFDIFYMLDDYIEMSGIAEIGRVTHHFGIDTGFITTIKPDLCVAKNPDPLSVSSEWGTDPEKETSGQLMMYGQSISKLTYYAVAITSTIYTARKFSRNLSIAGFVRVIGAMAGGVKGAYNGVGYVNASPNKFRAVRTVLDLKNRWGKFLKGAAIVQASVGGVGWMSLTLTAILWAGGEIFFNYLDKLFTQRFRNVIKIMPLYYKQKPYVAGINGHKHLIPGWYDNGNGVPIPYGEEDWKKLEATKKGYSSWEEYQEVKEERKAIATDPDTKKVVAGGESVNWLMENLDTDMMKANKKKVIFPVSESNTTKRNLAGVNSKKPNGRMGDGYGPRKTDTGSQFHLGADISKGPGGKLGNEADQKIYAMSAGRVMFAGVHGSYGNVIVIGHSYPVKHSALGKKEIDIRTNMGGHVFVYTVYAHLRKISIDDNVNIEAGQQIGLMGGDPDVDPYTRGKDDKKYSTGRHLHFEILIPKEAGEMFTTIQKISARTKDKEGKEHYHVIDPKTFFDTFGAAHPDLFDVYPK